MIHIVKGFGIVSKTEVDVFLELSCSFDHPVVVGNLISGSSAFSKSSLNIWKFSVHVQTRLLCPWNSPGKNTGVGCHSLCQGIFPTQEYRTQGNNPALPRCRQILCHLSQQGSPKAFFRRLEKPPSRAIVHSAVLFFIAELMDLLKAPHRHLLRVP